MSIDEQILHRVGEGRLVRMAPGHGDQVFRTLYLTCDLYDEFFLVRDDKVESKRYAEIRADLQVFISSPIIVPDYIKQLDPPREGIWEIKCTSICPQIRAFGMFAKKDIFICTNYEDRDVLDEFGSEEWKNEVRRAKSVWRNLLNPYQFKTTTNPHLLFSGATDEQYTR